jgi:hypothetical protein
MIQRLLQLLTIFDWLLLPRAAINNQRHVGNVAGVGAHVIMYPLECEAQALDVLRRKGITFWNQNRSGSQAQVWVKEAQGGLADTVLVQAGIPLK